MLPRISLAEVRATSAVYEAVSVSAAIRKVRISIDIGNLAEVRSRERSGALLDLDRRDRRRISARGIGKSVLLKRYETMRYVHTYRRLFHRLYSVDMPIKACHQNLTILGFAERRDVVGLFKQCG